MRLTINPKDIRTTPVVPTLSPAKRDLLALMASHHTMFASLPTLRVAADNAMAGPNASEDIARLARLAQGFSHHPAFVLEQFNAGHDVDKARAVRTAVIEQDREARLREDLLSRSALGRAVLAKP